MADSTGDLGSGHDSPMPLPVGTLVGRYRLLGVLGSGAMGVVYRAHDPQLERSVAVKVLHIDRPDAPARLRREAETLARLNHPNVVAVYDAGVVSGDAFVAMELIEGTDAAKWYELGPDTREVLRVYVAAARGLAAAHAAGVIHRDVKPANILLGPEGQVKVADFGMAGSNAAGGDTSDGMRLDDSDGSRTGPLIGTPRYMSPEQHRGRPADPASDQFGFCVALYHALFDRYPFDGDTLGELRASVFAGRPRPPRRTAVPRAVTAAVLRGLQARPVDRWPSMGALIDALTVATATGIKRSTWIHTAGVAVGLIVAGTAVAQAAARSDPHCGRPVSSMGEAWNDARRDALADVFAGYDYVGADEDWAAIEPRLEAHAGAWVEAWAAMCAAEQPPHSRDRRAACLERHRRSLAAQLDVFHGRADPSSARALVVTVASLPPLSCHDDAGVVAPDADDRLEFEAARSELDTIAALHSAGRYDEASELALEASWRVRDLGQPRMLAELMQLQAEIALKQDRYEAASEGFQSAHDVAAAVDAASIAAAAAYGVVFTEGFRLRHHDLAKHWRRVGNSWIARAEFSNRQRARLLLRDSASLRAEGEGAAAEQTARDALALVDDESVVSPTLALSHSALSLALEDLGRHDESKTHGERALEILEQAFGSTHPEVAKMLDNVAVELARRDQLDRAEDYHRRALAIATERYGPDSVRVAQSHTYLGDNASRRDEPDVALGHYRQALAIRRRLLAPGHPRTARSLNSIASMLMRKGDDGAEAAYLDALRAFERASGPRSTDVAMVLSNLGVLSKRRQDFDQAEVYLNRALEIREAVLGADHPKTANVVMNLATVHIERDEYEQAEALLGRAIEIYRGRFGANHRRVGSALINLCLVERGLERWDEAQVVCDQALAVVENVLGPEHSIVATALQNLGLTALARNEPERAKRHLERAVAIEQARQVPAVERAKTKMGLARAMWAVGERRQARELATFAREAFVEDEYAALRAEVDAWLRSH